MRFAVAHTADIFFKRGKQFFGIEHFAGVSAVICRAESHGIKPVIGEHGVFFVKSERLTEAVAQSETVMKRTAEKKHFSVYFASLCKSRDSLVDHRLINACRNIGFVCALVKKRLNIRFCKNAAAGRNGIKAGIFQAYFVHFIGRHIQKHRHLVDKCARAARTGAVHALVHAVLEENNLCVFSSEFHNNGRIGFFFADDSRRGVNFLNKRYFRGIGKPHTGRARDSDRELTPAQLRLYDAQHFKRLLPHLRKMTLIFVIKHFFTLDKHDFCGRRTYVNAERQNIFFFHNFFLFSLFRSISLYIESKNQIIV